MSSLFTFEPVLKQIAIIGGGAAGFFSAIQAKTNHPANEVVIFEKSRKVLSKVRISGGGRCNVTNATTSIAELARAYPRGGKQLKKLFKIFSTADIRDWFEKRGIALKVEPDGRVFPVSNRSETIINCLLNECEKLNVQICPGRKVESIERAGDGWTLNFKHEKSFRAFKVIIATGGSPKLEGLNWLARLGHQIETPVPSLFTFNMPDEAIRHLPGLSVPNAIVRIKSATSMVQAPLLITHWGMSGPAVLKLSAMAARELNALNYRFEIIVNWLGQRNEEIVKEQLLQLAIAQGGKQLARSPFASIPKRLWLFLLEKSGIDYLMKWEQLPKKGRNKLISNLCNDTYQVEGKTTFKEEFVTCGGVSLESVDMGNMQSKVCPGLYFCGEVLDIDGITGGYNFQAAWTTGFVAGRLG